MRALPSSRTVAVVALALAGCTEAAVMQTPPEEAATPVAPVAPAPAAPTIASLPAWHQNDANPQNKAGDFRWEKLDPRFVASVAAYSTELHALLATSVDRAPVARCLRDLADAIERVPRPGSVDTKAAAARVRVEADRFASADAAYPGTPSAQKEALDAALRAAAGAFVELSRTTYVVAPVASASRELEASIDAITPLGALASHQTQIYKALEHAEVALKAIQVEAAERAKR
ncbi:MAG TPA: hypothetical protein VGM56_24885 [Byssovorax sp.]|jgi:hypothetical protein